MQSMLGDKEMWLLNLELLPPTPPQKRSGKELSGKKAIKFGLVFRKVFKSYSVLKSKKNMPFVQMVSPQNSSTYSYIEIMPMPVLWSIRNNAFSVMVDALHFKLKTFTLRIVVNLDMYTKLSIKNICLFLF